MGKTSQSILEIAEAIKGMDGLTLDHEVLKVINDAAPQDPQGRKEFCTDLFAHYLQKSDQPMTLFATVLDSFPKYEDKIDILSESLSKAVQTAPEKMSGFFNEILSHLMINPIMMSDRENADAEHHEDMVIICSKAILSLVKSQNETQIHGLVKSVMDIGHIGFDLHSESKEVQYDILSTTLCGTVGIPDFPSEKKDMFLRGICKLDNPIRIVHAAQKELTAFEVESAKKEGITYDPDKDLGKRLGADFLIAQLDNVMVSQSPTRATAKALDTRSKQSGAQQST